MNYIVALRTYSKSLCRLFSILLLLTSQSAFGFFDSQIGVTLTLSFGVHVTGTARVVPFLIFPDGSSNIYDPEFITDSSFQFPDFVYENPALGVYGIGASVYAVTDAVVSVDTNVTQILRQAPSVPDAIMQVKPTIPNLYSVTISTGEFSALNIPLTYPGL